MFKSTFCSYLQIIKSVSNKIWDIQNLILDWSIFSVYGRGVRPKARRTLHVLHVATAARSLFSSHFQFTAYMGNGN